MNEKQSTRLLAISGNIGVGKTTLVKKLNESFGWTIIPEPYELNPFLGRFYEDMSQWAFHSQVFFLVKRLSLYVDALDKTGIFVQDRTVFEDAEIFAQNLYNTESFDRDSYNCYTELYEIIRKTIMPPTAIIYLRAQPQVLLERIRTRNRTCEQDVTLKYISQLNELYDTWADSFNLCPIVTVNTSKLDLVQNPRDLEIVKDECLSILTLI